MQFKCAQYHDNPRPGHELTVDSSCGAGGVVRFLIQDHDGTRASIALSGEDVVRVRRELKQYEPKLTPAEEVAAAFAALSPAQQRNAMKAIVIPLLTEVL